jgi:TldD protein
MLDPLHTLLRELVAELERHFPYAAALLSDVHGMQIRVNGREQRASEQDPARGVAFAVYDGASFVEYATADLAPDRLAAAVRAWAASLSLSLGGSSLPLDAIAQPGVALPAKPQVFRTGMELDPATVPLADKLAHVADLQHRAQLLDPRIVQATTVYSEETAHSTYIGRGRYLQQSVTRVVAALRVVVSDGIQTRWHALQRGQAAGFEVARFTDDELRKTVEIAVRLLEAGKIEPGEYDIITDPSVSGTIAHESFGHGVELDLYPKGRARSAQYLGRQVAASALQMFDDPSVPGGYGSYFFDDEGEQARPTQILRDGVFVSPISDLSSATFAPGARTPNGRRQDFTRKVYARMSNTFFGRGATPPAEIIAGIERGVYLRDAESGMEDPMGWGIQVTAHYAEEIRNGQCTGRLFAPVGVSGYVPDVLMSIAAIGDDFELSGGGACGKGHKELVRVATGGPHLRMRARLG